MRGTTFQGGAKEINTPSSLRETTHLFVSPFTKVLRLLEGLVNVVQEEKKMKTFFEFFLKEIARKLKAGEIDEEKAARWIAEVKAKLEAYAKENPAAPIAQMPVTH